MPHLLLPMSPVRLLPISPVPTPFVKGGGKGGNPLPFVKGGEEGFKTPSSFESNPPPLSPS
jgi:hypothetical protein